MILYLIIGIAVIAISVVTFIACSPQFGGKLSKEQVEHYSKSKNFKDGKFINKDGLDVSPKISISGFFEVLGSLFKKDPNAKLTTPTKNIDVEPLKLSDISRVKDSVRLVWFGHSTFLLQLNNKYILIDPMFGDVPSPVSWAGWKRFSNKLPIEIEKLPKIDAVILSHDHYDHLDHGSILEIKDKVGMFYTPLGLSIHLERWGVDKDKIVELDWWGETKLDDLIFRSTPSQHSSGRRMDAMSNTLWSSWIISSDSTNIFFSGDGGYAEHFKQIGDKYGPFDFAMLECGQYDQQWPLLHMFPEQTAQAGIDLKAKKILPIHWGAFRLAAHPWQEPVERLKVAAEKLNLPVIIPKIGEPILIESEINYSNESWWEKY